MNPYLTKIIRYNLVHSPVLQVIIHHTNWYTKKESNCMLGLRILILIKILYQNLKLLRFKNMT
jgi:hypothetical protein